MAIRLLIVLMLIASSGLGQAESLFDRYLRQNNGQIPIPFTSLTDMITARGNERATSAGMSPVRVEKVLVPDGRSVQKNKTDFRNPRVLYAIDTPDGKIYLGYAKDATQIEIMSWNQETKAFDFQVVQDYQQGGTPNIHTAPPGACTSCHQNGGPIFPASPWSEMESQALYQEMRRETGRDSYEGVPLPDPLTSSPALGFEDLVRLGSVELQRGNICSNACGSGSGTAVISCRKNLLFLALNSDIPPTQNDIDLGLVPPMSEAEQISARRRTQAVEELRLSFRSNWPQENFVYPEPILPDRDPYEERKGAYTGDQKRLNDPLTPRAASNPVSADSFLTFVSQDPAGVLQCLGMDSRERDAFKNFNRSELYQAINSRAINSLLQQSPLNRDAIAATLLRQLNAGQYTSNVQAYCRAFNSRLGPVDGMPVVPLEDSSEQLSGVVYPAKDLFIKYCQRCHTKDNNPLPFNDYQAMKDYGGDNPNDMIQGRLQRHFSPEGDGPAQMPPEGTIPTPTDSERREMIRALNRFLPRQ